jgi:hypothetical protein
MTTVVVVANHPLCQIDVDKVIPKQLALLENQSYNREFQRHE